MKTYVLAIPLCAASNIVSSRTEISIILIFIFVLFVIAVMVLIAFLRKFDNTNKTQVTPIVPGHGRDIVTPTSETQFEMGESSDIPLRVVMISAENSVYLEDIGDAKETLNTESASRTFDTCQEGNVTFRSMA
jgi:ABC-type lipoprotein release transport system permease subunit